MAKTSKELKLVALDKINAGRLSWAGQNDVSFERGLHHKFDQQLLDGVELYESKYQRLVEGYKGYLDEIHGKIKNFNISKSELKDDLLSMKGKVIRMADKYWALKWEIEGRRLDIFKRKPVGTIYYIDLDGGNDGNDGLSIGQAWLTLEKYTSVTARSPGDIAKVRANTTQTKTDADIVLDEDGSVDERIEIRGCSSSDDPWGDGSDVRPILTFDDNEYRIYPSLDHFWKISRLIVKKSSHTNGNIYSYGCKGWHYIDCDFMDCSGGIGYGVHLGQINRGMLFENCLFKNNRRYNFLTVNSHAKLKNCTFDPGTINTWYGVGFENSSRVELIDCDIGQDNPHQYYDIVAAIGSITKLRNCKIGDAGILMQNGIAVVYEEDADGVYGAHKATYYHGIVTKDTGITRSGGASSSAKMEPNSDCGINLPLTLNDNSLVDSAFKVWLSSGVEKTITVYIRSLGAWGTYPTNTELYIEANYLSSGVSAARTEIKSTQVLSDETTWVAFTITLTPQQTGFVYLDVYLKKYQSGKGCYVDVKPEVI